MASANAIKAGEIALDMSVTGLTESEGDLKKLAEELRKTGQEGAKQSKSIAKYTKLVSGLVALQVVARTFNQIGNAVMSVADRVDKLAKSADRMGMSVKEATQMGTLAELGGADIKAFETAMAAMNRKIGEAKLGSQEAINVFKNMGIELSELTGKSGVEQFKMISDGINRMAEESDRAAIRMKVFSESGNQVANLTNKGSEGITKMQKAMEDLGIGPSDKMVTDFVMFKDLMTIVEKKFISVKDKLIDFIVPALNEMLIGMIAFADTSGGAFQKLAETMSQITMGAESSAESFSVLTAVLDGLVIAVKILANGFLTVRAALYGVLGVASALAGVFGSIVDSMTSMFGMTTSFGEFFDAFADGAMEQAAADVGSIETNANQILQTFQNMGSSMDHTSDRIAEVRQAFEDMKLGTREGTEEIQDFRKATDEAADGAKKMGMEVKKALNFSGAFDGQGIIARGAAGQRASQDANLKRMNEYLKTIANNTENSAIVQGL